MAVTKILYTSAEVQKAVAQIFRTAKGRRVAITAFVGKDALAYLPRPEGIELICWPKAGGTNPNELKKLMKHGVHVSFSDNLHMKLYWTEDVGAVITSANLSTNALGAGPLQELGILVPSARVDIDKVLRSTAPREIKTKELRKLEIAHDEYQRRHRGGVSSRVGPSFMDWWRSRKPSWKIAYWQSLGNVSKASQQKAKKEFGSTFPDWVLGCQPDRYKEEDWILTFRLDTSRPARVRWLRVDFVTRVPKAEKAYDPEGPREAVQVWPARVYKGAPFDVDDRFRVALYAALKEFGVDKFRKLDPNRPSPNLIDLIRRNY